MLTFHLPTHQRNTVTGNGNMRAFFCFLKLCSYDNMYALLSTPRSRCLCKLSQERQLGYSVVRPLPPVKIKYETFIIQGGLI